MSAPLRKWLVFNVRRRVWWGDGECGYTDDVREAGQYTDAEALRIVHRMNWTPPESRVPGEGAGDHTMIVPAENWVRS
jgi:hypothetical protein